MVPRRLLTAAAIATRSTASDAHVSGVVPIFVRACVLRHAEQLETLP